MDRAWKALEGTLGFSGKLSSRPIAQKVGDCLGARRNRRPASFQVLKTRVCSYRKPKTAVDRLRIGR
jgi:hypothetical protein